MQLFDITNNVFVFYHEQVSTSTPNENFTLGLAGGDFQNTVSGPLTGTLTAGNDYRLHYNASIAATASIGATATGFVSIAFTAVPEPSTTLCLIIGSFSLAGLKAKRRR
jgi:hypothetical protein